MGAQQWVHCMSWIEEHIPGASNRHQITSDPTAEYNCIAWAAGVEDEWWSHLPGYKWPTTRSPLVSSLIRVFETLGYHLDATDLPGSLETGYEKVAIYASGELWTHAAKQLPSGRWASKLGVEEDIRHDSAECLQGTMYGQIHCYMRRPIDA